MRACTRCGAWHTVAEKHAGHFLSCTEVKRFWGEVKRRHREASGHAALLTLDDDGRVFCLECNEELTPLL